MRDGRDVLQSDVAAALNVGAATISRWEADQAIPREDALARLAAFLGVTPAYLRYGIRAGADPANPLKPQEVAEFVNHEMAASRAKPEAPTAPAAAKKAAGGTKGKTRGR